MKLLLLLAMTLSLAACHQAGSIGGDDDTDTETGPDVDSDTDADTDTDSDTDTGTDSSTDTAVDGGIEEGEVFCGWGICTNPEICCVTETPPTQECMTPSMCSGDFLAMCDGPEDCGEDGHCCLPTGGVSNSWCSSTECMVTACHTEADCPGGDFCCTDFYFGYSMGVCSIDPC